jgi:hypothetical protein
MISRNSIYFGFFLFVFAAVAVVIILYARGGKSGKPSQITNFEQCSAAGYPVMQSYPRQCSLPDGRFFVETGLAGECSKLEDCASGSACVNHACQVLRAQ